ncbi:MAG: oxidoreductase [Deltaproteobacteria bacterium]|nr:oxidoreductase [Deltaproteobacteria bacterium]
MSSDAEVLYEHRVIDLEEVTAGKCCLRFERRFDFTAGQVVAVGHKADAVPRLYSICSGERDLEMQLLFDVKQDGDLTPKLAAMKAGDSLWVSKPYGQFLPQSDMPMWWIATGTGIAPFYSMMQSGHEAKRLIHGARDVSQFYFEPQFQCRFGDSYVRCCSQGEHKTAFNGRVTAYLASLDAPPTDVRYYVCGHPLMVVEMRDILIAKGVPFGNIIAEIYC